MRFASSLQHQLTLLALSSTLPQGWSSERKPCMTIRLRIVKQEGAQDGLLDVQAVLCLGQHPRLWSIDHLVGNLFAPMRGQWVQDYRVGMGQREQARIDAIAGEDGAALLRLSFLAHAGPDISREDISASRRLVR